MLWNPLRGSPRCCSRSSSIDGTSPRFHPGNHSRLFLKPHLGFTIIMYRGTIPSMLGCMIDYDCAEPRSGSISCGTRSGVHHDVVADRLVLMEPPRGSIREIIPAYFSNHIWDSPLLCIAERFHQC